MPVGYGYRPICDLTPLSESLRDSESHLNVHSRGMQGQTGCGGIIFMCSSTDGGLLSYLENNPCANYNVQNNKGLNSP